MKMKFKKIKLALLAFMGIFLLTNMAYSFEIGVSFDNTGSGANYDYDLYGFSYDQYGSLAANEGQDTKDMTNILDNNNLIEVDIITEQSFTHTGDTDPTILGDGDIFRETISFSVQDSLWFDGSSYSLLDDLSNDDAYQINMEIYLEGHITDYSNSAGDVDLNDSNTYENIQDATYTSVFDDGSVTMYNDANSNGIQDGTEDTIALFNFVAGDDINLTPTVFAGGTVGSAIAYAFEWDYANPLYWEDALFDPTGTLLSDLIFLDLAFASTTDNITGIDALGFDSTNETLLIPFAAAGGDAVLSAIPEPTTILLFGIGLIGLAGASRRKIS